MTNNITEENALYLAATMDNFGQIGIKNDTMFVKFKTARLERIQVICAALGIDERFRGPFDNGGVSKRPQYELVLIGATLAILENIVVSRMRTSRCDLFQKTRQRLAKLRSCLGMSGSFKIARAENL